MQQDPVRGPISDAAGDGGRLENRVAVVTGIASGIGRAIAVRFAREGARVFGGDLDALAENEQLFDELGIELLACDVRSEADVRRLVERARELSGRVDIAVNNAGIGMVKPITEVSEQEWDACLGTNLKGAFLVCKHVIPAMKESGGSIINIASNAGLLPRAHDPVYSISKGALLALTRSLALCHSVDRIRINAICPGPVGETRIMNANLETAPDPEAARQQIIQASPLAKAYGRMIAPEEVAAAALYLAGEEASMVTGTAIAIDGGKSLGVPPR